MIEPPSVRSGKAFCTVNSVPLTIDVEQLVEMLFGDGPEGNEFANTGVGENNIDLSLHLSDGFDNYLKRRSGASLRRLKKRGRICRCQTSPTMPRAAKDRTRGMNCSKSMAILPNRRLSTASSRAGIRGGRWELSTLRQ
jgi:hypothetical protein